MEYYLEGISLYKLKSGDYSSVKIFSATWHVQILILFPVCPIQSVF